MHTHMHMGMRVQALATHRGTRAVASKALQRTDLDQAEQQRLTFVIMDRKEDSLILAGLRPARAVVFQGCIPLHLHAHRISTHHTDHTIHQSHAFPPALLRGATAASAAATTTKRKVPEHCAWCVRTVAMTCSTHSTPSICTESIASISCSGGDSAASAPLPPREKSAWPLHTTCSPAAITRNQDNRARDLPVRYETQQAPPARQGAGTRIGAGKFSLTLNSKRQ